MERIEHNVSTGEVTVVQLTDEEVTEAESYAADISRTEMAEVYQASARTALFASDTTLMRCYEAGIALPAEWAEYRKALRSIISAQSGDPAQQLPTRPSYPEGT